MLHNFDENDVNLYLSNFSRIFRTSQINQYSDMLWNKLSCHFMLQSLFKDVVPVVIAAVSRGKLVGIDIQEKDILGLVNTSKADTEYLLSRSKALKVKMQR